MIKINGRIEGWYREENQLEFLFKDQPSLIIQGTVALGRIPNQELDTLIGEFCRGFSTCQNPDLGILLNFHLDPIPIEGHPPYLWPDQKTLLVRVKGKPPKPPKIKFYFGVDNPHLLP